MHDQPPFDVAAPAVILARPVRSAPPPGAAGPLELPTVTASRAWRAALLTLFVGLALPIALGVAFAIALGGAEDTPPAQFLVISKCIEALLVLVLARYFMTRHRLTPAAFGAQTRDLTLQALWSIPTLVALYVGMLGVGLIVVLLAQSSPAMMEDLESRKEFIALLPRDLLMTVLLLIPVAIHEELLFRGLLIPYLRRAGLGWIGAISASSLLFAVLHISQGVLAIPQILAVGLILSLAFVGTRSLLAVILAHFLFNLLQAQLAHAFFN